MAQALGRLVAVVLAAFVALAAPLRAADVPRVIFDSDMSSDHDDAGDIAVLHGLASLGEIRIIGMMVSSRNYGTAQLMDAVNTWYGKPDIPIGLPPDIGGVGEYPGMTVGTGRWPHTMGATKEVGLGSGAAMWAKDLYRKLLAESPDHSVVIVSTGYVQNIEALMLSTADVYSPLSGIDLVRRKVTLWSCAGGDYPSGSEFNFRVGSTMPRPAYTAVNQWPTRAWFVSYAMGQSIYTGGLLPEARADHPIRYIYVDSNSEDFPYPSWGQQMVYYAARGLDTFWGGHDTGRNNADTEGSNWWTETPELTGDRNQGYLLEKVRTPVQESLDALIQLEPNNGSPSRPGQPSNLRATTVSGSQITLQWRDNAFNESGFRIERGINGVYTQIGSVGANVTSFADTGLSSVANIGYRVKAWNATGDSRYSSTWVYSGWTDVSLSGTPGGPLYTSYQPCHLRYTDGIPQYEHVTLNNDSTHGQNLTIAVDAGATDNQGVFHVYFLYQNASNWYRLVLDNRHDQQHFRFEKRIAGVTTTVGSPRVLAHTTPVQFSEHALHTIGSGSLLRQWQIQVTPGSLSFQTSQQYLADDHTRPTSTISLNVSETLSLTSGLIGLGSLQQRPIWENVRFISGATAALAPSIVSHPQNTSVFAGRTATLTVAASGTGPLGFQWKRGATNVGTSSPTLTIANAQEADEGSYTCVVTNTAGSATSNAATLTVNPVIAPTITTHPNNALTSAGDSAVFTVAASGTAPLRYQWKHGTANVGTDSTTLTLTNVQASDAGSYTCVVTNSAGSAMSNAATLTLIPPLDPIIAASAYFNDGGGTYGGYPNTAEKAYDGDTATFYDAAAGSGAYTGIDAGSAKTVTAIRYVARAGQVGRMTGGIFEGSNTQGSGYVTLHTVTSASDTVWTTVLVSGAAQYRYFRYRGPNGTGCNVAEIEFRGISGAPTPSGPVITGHPTSQTVTVGATATVTVTASGSATLRYQWKRGTTNVGTDSATLTIANAQEADEGSYTCVVTNGVGSATSNTATLTVDAAPPTPVAPTITGHPTSMILITGGSGSFTVTATGTAPLSYQWKHGTTNVGTNSATLAITDAEESDEGSYTCVVTNSVGSAMSNAATLTVTASSGPDPLVTGTVFHDGGGSYGSSSSTADKAYDGMIATFYDADTANGAYTGIDVGAGTSAIVTSIRYHARSGWAGRMIGGVFEGSNSQASGYATLGTVATASDSGWTTIAVSGAAAYRYLRYRSPNGGFCNVAEIGFHGTSGSGPSPTAPSITGHPANQTVIVGGTATFTVVATGTGPLSYQWRRGTTTVGTTSATLTIANAQESDAGSYTCVVSNSVGSASSNPATLTVNAPAPGSPPPTPSGTQANGLATASPSLSGTGQPGSTIHILDGGVEIGTAIVDSSGTWSFAIGALTPGVHVFTFTASNASGTSAPSAPMTVTIPASGGGGGGGSDGSTASDSKCGDGSGIAFLLACLFGLHLAGGRRRRE